MKEQLVELLGLKPAKDATEVTDQAVLDAVLDLQRRANAETNAKKTEAEITSLMKESGYSLSRDAAKQVLADRATQKAKTEAAKK